MNREPEQASDNGHALADRGQLALGTMTLQKSCLDTVDNDLVLIKCYHVNPFNRRHLVS